MSYINKEAAIDLIESMIADKGVAFNPHKLAMALKDMESVEIPEAKDTDLISRQAAIELACWRCDKCERQDCEYKDSCKTMELLDALPSEDVKPPMLNNDCISRQAAIDAVEKAVFKGVAKSAIESLPPVNQKQITGKLETAEISPSDGDGSTMGQPKSKLYIPLNEYTVDRINRLHKNDCGDYFDEEWLYNELEQIAEKLQLSPETSTNEGVAESATTTDCISRADAINVRCAHCDTRDCCRDCSEVEILLSLPPVEPERPKGEWISLFDGNEWFIHCSKCKTQHYEEDLLMGGSELPNFCPNCGANMRGEEDD